MVGCSLSLFYHLCFHHDLVHRSVDEENEAIQKQALQQGSTAWWPGRRVGSAQGNVGPADPVQGYGCLPLAFCRKRSSSHASLLLTSGRGSVSGRSQPASSKAQKGQERREKSRWQEREWGGRERSEARRGRSSRAGAGFDLTIRPSCFPPSQQQPSPAQPSLRSVCPSVLVARPLSLSNLLSWSACHSAQSSAVRERLTDLTD